MRSFIWNRRLSTHRETGPVFPPGSSDHSLVARSNGQLDSPPNLQPGKAALRFGSDWIGFCLLCWLVSFTAVFGAPDIAILLTDQQRADALGVVDPTFHTPTMDRLAREGIRFTHAFCATPQCSPARAALLTGQYPHRVGVMGNVGGGPIPAGMSPGLDQAIPSLGKIFSAAGYETAYFGKWHLGKTPAEHGFQTKGGERNDEEATREAVAFLSKRQETAGERRPLLLVVSWVNPHDIYEASRSARYDPDELSKLSLPSSLDDDLTKKPFPQKHYLEADQGRAVTNYRHADWQRYLAAYRELAAKVDAQMGRVLREFRQASPNSLIIFSSDHGDLGGAHGLPFKGPALYDELVRVPLIISQPGTIEPDISDAMVSHIDLLPTLCEWAGLTSPRGIDGKSLWPLLTGTSNAPAGRDAIFAEYYGKQNWRVPIRMIRTKEWKYVRYLNYGEELYHLKSDPAERVNLASAAEHQRTKSTLAARLDGWIAETNDPFSRLKVTDRDGKLQF